MTGAPDEASGQPREDHGTNTVEDAERFERHRVGVIGVRVGSRPMEPDDVPGPDEL